MTKKWVGNTEYFGNFNLGSTIKDLQVILDKYSSDPFKGCKVDLTLSNNCEVEVWRLETDSEYEKRLSEEDDVKAESERQERILLETLKAKYEDKQ